MVDLALAADEGLDKVQLLRGQAGKGTIGEAAFDGRFAGFAMQVCHGQLPSTDRAFAQGGFHGFNLRSVDILPVEG